MVWAKILELSKQRIPGWAKPAWGGREGLPISTSLLLLALTWGIPQMNKSLKKEANKEAP